jgi:uncharacterized protein with PIN domain
MLDRLQRGHEFALRSLLSLAPHRCSLDALASRLMRAARRRSQGRSHALTVVLDELHETVRRSISRRLQRAGAGDLWTARSQAHGDSSTLPRFVCDGSLGGLSRWLRAAGYEAEWTADETAWQTLSRARSGGPRVLITTNSQVLDHFSALSHATIVLWVPSYLRCVDQTAWIMRDLSLLPKTPRCMACGGRLVAVEKQSVSARIPPRTARWKESYTLCRGCGRLFWEGTHWERIRARLLEVGGVGASAPAFVDAGLMKV